MAWIWGSSVPRSPSRRCGRRSSPRRRGMPGPSRMPGPTIVASAPRALFGARCASFAGRWRAGAMRAPIRLGSTDGARRCLCIPCRRCRPARPATQCPHGVAHGVGALADTAASGAHHRHRLGGHCVPGLHRAARPPRIAARPVRGSPRRGDLVVPADPGDVTQNPSGEAGAARGPGSDVAQPAPTALPYSPCDASMCHAALRRRCSQAGGRGAPARRPGRRDGAGWD